MNRPTLFLLHGLGMSARFWDRQIAALGDAYDCVALDLPGFGDAADATGITVEEMVDWLAREIQVRAPAAWMVVGHSMGGKLGTLVAARAEAGEPGLAGLAGVVLLAASPPSPEPMDDNQRDEMIQWFRESAPSEEEATRFVEANIADELPPAVMAQVVSDVRRTSRNAWLGWLERGSREDWSGAVGIIQAPALIMAGGEDSDLGEANQRLLTMPYFANASFEVVAHAAHFLPLEQPTDVADRIARHWRRVTADETLSLAVRRLIASDRTSGRTRRILSDRLKPMDGSPRCLTASQLGVLGALVGRILPSCGDATDLARRIDATLAAGVGDGWRFAALPCDRDAWRLGLDTLAAPAIEYAALPPDMQDRWLEKMAVGAADFGGDAGLLSGDQMKLWFEDVRAEVVRTWLSHPLAMARIGYDGFANGGDGRRKQGFSRLAADDRDAWQLSATGNSGS